MKVERVFLKRKTQPEPEEAAVVAVDAVVEEKSKRPAKCIVCASETSPNSQEGLCWVCRRLKISAWRDSDTQMPSAE